MKLEIRDIDTKCDFIDLKADYMGHFETVNTYSSLTQFLKYIEEELGYKHMEVEVVDGSLADNVFKIIVDDFKSEADYAIQCHEERTGLVFDICIHWFQELVGCNDMTGKHFFIKITEPTEINLKGRRKYLPF